MRFRGWLLCLGLGSPLVMAAQSAPTAPVKPADAMRAEVADAFERNSLLSMHTLFHMLATFQTFGLDGSPAGDGSFETTNDRHGHVKTVTTFRGHTMTEYVNGSEHRYTDDGFAGSILLYRLQHFALNPVPVPSGLEKRELEYKPMQLAGTSLDCVLYQFYAMPGLPTPPKEVTCVTQDTHDMVMAETQHMSVRYREFAPFASKSIARRISVIQGAVLRARVRVEQVDEVVPEEGALLAPENASPASPGVNWVTTSQEEDAPARRVMPVYPEQLKSAKVQGWAVAFALTSPEGKVVDVEPLYAPAPEMAQAMVDAAKSWTYPPLIRHGRAISTIRTIVNRFEPPRH